MSLLKMMVRDAGLMRQSNIGDLLGASEIITAVTVAASTTLTGPLICSNIIYRTGLVGAATDSSDTAANIIAQLPGAATGDSWRLRYINANAFILTLGGPIGVSVTNGTVNANSVKDFLVQLTNATPQSIATGSVTNASAVITGMSFAATGAVTPGMLVTGAGITAGTTVLSVQTNVGVTLSAAATATATLGALTFNPVVTITGIGQALL